MRWIPGGRSENLEDQRGGGGGIGPRHLGVGGVIILLVLSVVFKRDFFSLIGDSGAGAGAGVPSPVADSAEEPMVRFVSFVLDTTQATWAKLLPAAGKSYRPARLVLFRDYVQSACGAAQTASGPFYCPGDEKVYIDLGFYEELSDRFGAPGDFAEAYVLAHEIGHHVQKLLGIESQVRQLQQDRPSRANDLSVRLELQADCYAGVWGHTAAQENILEPGDVDEGIKAAGAVGDDRLQKMATGTVHPESFTHGTSAQRIMWFKRGYETGQIEACDTFGRE